MSKVQHIVNKQILKYPVCKNVSEKVTSQHTTFN